MLEEDHEWKCMNCCFMAKLDGGAQCLLVACYKFHHLAVRC